MRLFSAAFILSMATTLASADETLDKAIADLSSDEADVRDAAEKTLTDAGKDVLDSCRNALAKAEDPEVTARLKRIVERIEAALAVVAPAKTPHEAFDRLMLASDERDGKKIWALLSIRDRQRYSMIVDGILATLPELEQNERDGLAEAGFGVEASELEVMSRTTATIAMLAHAAGSPETALEIRDSKLAGVEERDEKAYCKVLKPDGNGGQKEDYEVFIQEDGGWRLDMEESQDWAEEIRKEK